MKKEEDSMQNRKGRVFSAGEVIGRMNITTPGRIRFG